MTPINRLGDHWAVEIDVGVLQTLCGRALLADIVRGTAGRIRVPIPQRGLAFSPATSRVPFSDGSTFSDDSMWRVGTAHVKGDGQAGQRLLLEGLAPGYPIQKGRFLTLETSEGSSAHIFTSDAEVSEGGEVVVDFWPILWRQPRDGDHVEIDKPYLEGLVVDAGGQSIDIFASVRTDRFTIEEEG